MIWWTLFKLGAAVEAVVSIIAWTGANKWRVIFLAHVTHVAGMMCESRLAAKCVRLCGEIGQNETEKDRHN